MSRFTPETRLSRTQELPATDLDQETVLMSVDAGAYYGLAGPARSIWTLLEAPLTFGALVDRLVQAYNVSPETCASDLATFLEDMEREGLVRVE
jgi:hypothetical protein